MSYLSSSGDSPLIASRPILLTNTLGHALDEFCPLTPGIVRMYSCGPTVYNYAHIGNFRSFIMADLLRRVLEYNGYDVIHARNITDVGHLTDETLSTGLDRIERAARDQDLTPWDIAQYYTDAFLRDAAALNLKEPTFMPRATEYIEPMIRLTEQLIHLGYAYEADGNVYFDVTRFPDYGKLSGNTTDELIAGHRVEVGESKRSPADFALWRAAGPDRIMRWPSPWGEGVPGWHLECSAMAFALLGEQIDIHTGGVDNLFPHHEDEIAQSEAATGKRFARYWLHGAHLQASDSEKMSKSLGNIFTISELEEMGFHPLTYRYFTFQAHYRTLLTFNLDALAAAQTALVRLWEASAELIQSVESATQGTASEEFRERFHEAINRDLDFPQALAVLHEAMGAKLPMEQKLWLLGDFDRVLGLDLVAMGQALSATTSDQEKMLERRAEARVRRDWEASDHLREELLSLGLEVRDTAQGQRWVRRDLLPRQIRDA